MNGFLDLHMVFEGGDPPSTGRGGVPWRAVDIGDGAVWMGVAGAADGVGPTRASGWRLWAVGDVFAYRGSTDAPLDGFARDLVAGGADPALLDSHAVVFGWEEAARRLHVWTDRMGTSHVYRGGTVGRASVGTCFAAVAHSSTRSLDWIGITGFCGFGFYPADRTRYEDVRMVRPATHVVFAADGTQVSSRRYWNWWHEPEHDRSDDSFVDEFHETWMRTVRTQCGDRRIVVPVSGGLDSRTVLGAVTAPDSPAGGAVRTLTYGYSHRSAEITISRSVAARRGLEPAEFVIGPYLFERLSEVSAAVEGFQALTYTRQAAVASELPAMGERVVGGHWGDVWFDAGSESSSDVSVLVDAACRKFTKNGSGWLLDNVCAPHLDGADPRHVLRDLVRDEVVALPDLGHPEMVLKALKTDQWSFRWTLASVRAYQLGLPTLLPFYANDVVDLFLRIPPERLVGRRLQVAYLKRHHQDLARARWQDSGMSLFERPWEPVAALARRGRNKVARVVSRRPAIQRNWEVQYLQGDGPSNLRTLLLGQPAEVVSGVSSALRSELVDALLADPSAGRGYTVDALATLAVPDPVC